MRNIAGRVRVIRSSRSAVRSRTHADAPSGVRREYSRTNATKIACAISPATEDKNGVPAACERVRVVMETTASWQAEGNDDKSAQTRGGAHDDPLRVSGGGVLAQACLGILCG